MHAIRGNVLFTMSCKQENSYTTAEFNGNQIEFNENQIEFTGNQINPYVAIHSPLELSPPQC